MSTASVTGFDSWDFLLDIWRELDVPDGWRPELTTEGIVMTPPPSGPHNRIAELVHSALFSAAPRDCGIYQTLGVGIERVEGIYIPDLCVVPRDLLPDDATPVPAEHVLLAVEITSKSNAEHDRTTKKWAYAHGPIPRYVLIDPFDPAGASVSVCTEPKQGAYGKTIRVPFGEPAVLGEPFDIELDTSTF